MNTENIAERFYSVEDLCSALDVSLAPRSGNFFDFSHDKSQQGPSVDELRDMYVQGEGKSGVTRWTAFTRLAGKEIADAWAGRKSLDDALGYMLGWVAGHLERPEDWDDAQVHREFDALARVHQGKHGPIAPPPIKLVAPATLKLHEYGVSRFMRDAPPDRWLIKDRIVLGAPGIIAGAGGVGKSFLCLELALRVAGGTPGPKGAMDFGHSAIFGGEVSEFGAAVFLTAEETETDILKRLAVLDPDRSRRKAAQGRLYIRPIRGGYRLLKRGRHGDLEVQQAFADLRDELKAISNLKLVVIDPVAAFAGGALKDREDVQSYADLMTELCDVTGATAATTVHLRKNDAKNDGKNDGKRLSVSDVRNQIHGSAGWVDAFRFAYGLAKTDKTLSRELAPKYGLSADHGQVVCGALLKANGAREDEKFNDVYERQESGNLHQLSLRIDLAKQARDEQRVALVSAVKRYAQRKQPFMLRGINGIAEKENRHCLPPELRELSRDTLRALAQEALNIGEIKQASTGSEKQQKWLCVSDDVVDMGDGSFNVGGRPRWEELPAEETP